MTKQLYKLTEDYKALEILLEDETFRPDDIHNMLKEIKQEMGDKVENIAKLILSLQAEAEMIKQEKERLNSRQQAHLNQATWLKGYILNEMITVGISRVKRELLTVSVQDSPPSAEVVALELIPEEFLKVISEPKRQAIIEHFKATGEIIPGINIITDKKHIVIR